MSQTYEIRTDLRTPSEPQRKARADGSHRVAGPDRSLLSENRL